MIKKIWSGLINLLPMVILIWILYSIFVAFNNLGLMLIKTIHIHSIFPGEGFVLTSLILIVFGLIFSFRPILWCYSKVEHLIIKFPIIKIVYNSIKDFTSLINNKDEHNQRQTVLVRQSNGSYMVGFLMSDETPKQIQALNMEKELVPVLYQLSYQIAGITVLVDKKDLIPLDWSFEEAMKFNLTAGINPNKDNKSH